MMRINLLIVFAVMLASGLAMIVLFIQIFPGNADGRLPMALTGGGMVAVGFIATEVMRRLTR